ncbi:MAG: hypothetical protein V1704_02425 [Candidatus Vogelbacteria bacterium]
MSTPPKDRFFRVYANLPVGLRDQVIIVLPEVGPMSWNAVYIEVSNNTKLGDTIVEKLVELKII